MRYTPQETALLAVMDRTAALPLDESQAALAALIGTDGFESPDTHALVLFEQCSLAGASFSDVAPYADGLDALRDAHPGVPFVVAAQRDCELRRHAPANTAAIFEARTQLYRDSADLPFPSVRYRLASGYVHDALALGFIDEALQAVQRALQIAEANDDVPYRRDSLMDLALVRSGLHQHEQAIADSAAALAIGQGDRRVDLLLNRGYILRQARRPQEAADVYRRAQALAQEQDAPERILTAMLNLSSIHASQQDVAENLALTGEAMALADRIGNDYFRGYAANARAFALFDAGRAAAADAMFARGRELLERAGEQADVASHLADWAQRLADRNRHAEAFRALADSHAMDAEIRSSERERHARYLGALLDARQKDVAIERLRGENEVARLEIEKRRLNAAAWGIGLASVSLAALTLLLSHLRLRRSSRQLATVNARLDHENAHDSLTGLHNRAYFVRRFEAMKQASPGTATLALLDLDHFKRINDRFGHAAGDEVLREAARRMASAVRGHDLAARWGGEEFIILAPALDGGTRGAEIAARLLQTLSSAPVQVGDAAITLTASIGYAEIELGGHTSLDTELEPVDAALYRAKEAGRNRAIAAVRDD